MNVMFALAIAGTVLTPIFISQGSAMERMRDESQAVKRLFFAQQFLYDAEIKLLQGAAALPEKRVENPAMRITFKESEPTKQSALDRFPGIVMRTVSWQWQEDREQHNDQLLSLVYKPKEQSA